MILNIASRYNIIKIFFRFPQIPSIIEKWIEASGRNNWIPNESSVISEIHFKAEDFSNTKIRKRLKADAVPTKHLYENAITADMYGHNALKNVKYTY